MNIKTKFKIGDTVKIKTTPKVTCYHCGHVKKNPINGVQFVIEEITIRLFNHKDSEVMYSDGCHIYGCFSEDQLIKVNK